MGNSLIVSFVGFISGVLLTFRPGWVSQIIPSHPVSSEKKIALEERAVLSLNQEKNNPLVHFSSIIFPTSVPTVTKPTVTPTPTSKPVVVRVVPPVVTPTPQKGPLWRLQELPTVGDKTVAFLKGVGASSSTNVWAVGTSSKPYVVDGLYRAVPQALAMRWDGARWDIKSPTSPSSDTELNAVAVLAPNDVWAVGSYKTDTTPNTIYPRSTFITHWNGHDWQQIPSPDGQDEPNSPHLSTLESIHAVNANDIWASGGVNYSKPLLMHWDGATWSLVATPSYKQGDASQAGSVNNVQFFADNLWVVAGQLYTRNGTQWEKKYNATPPVSNSTLHALGIRSPSDIWVGGDDCRKELELGGCIPLFVHWDGSSWNEISHELGVHRKYGRVISDIVTISDNDVWAFGTYNNVVDHMLVAHWDGHNWKRMDVPSRSKGDHWLYGAVGLSPKNIWAVGLDSGTKDDPYGAPIILHYSE